IGSIILIPAALLSISSRYLRLRIVPGDTMVCGGHVCSKNTLCALNILYCTRSDSKGGVYFPFFLVGEAAGAP
ncbi:hypothetical protein D4764_10G0010290, partial [Takifugu flavidus]